VRTPRFCILMMVATETPPNSFAATRPVIQQRRHVHVTRPALPRRSLLARLARCLLERRGATITVTVTIVAAGYLAGRGRESARDRARDAAAVASASARDVAAVVMVTVTVIGGAAPLKQAPGETRKRDRRGSAGRVT